MKTATVIWGMVVVFASGLASAAETRTGKVVRVPRGDALVVLVDGRQQPIALAGVAAPSKNEDLARQSKENLAAKVADHEVVVQVLSKDEKRGAVAAVWLDQRSINAEMIREGWAWYDRREGEFKTLADAETEAKTANRGVWAQSAEKPPWEDAAADDATSADAPAAAKPEPKELAVDDGTPAGKRSLPQGFAVRFETPEGKWMLTSVRIHGSRYGHPTPPREKFHVTICDTEFKPLADFPYPYSNFRRTAEQNWVALKMKPTELPREFILCVDFNAEATKGVYVSHDAEGEALVGKPNRSAGVFNAGDWLIRAVVTPAP
ncbi:MAG: thermonuclease family protein [Pirellulales bacterium]|nr:thermonuclease family protein [Pirellulales bacterium]